MSRPAAFSFPYFLHSTTHTVTYVNHLQHTHILEYVSVLYQAGNACIKLTKRFPYGERE